MVAEDGKDGEVSRRSEELRNCGRYLGLERMMAEGPERARGDRNVPVEPVSRKGLEIRTKSESGSN